MKLKHLKDIREIQLSQIYEMKDEEPNNEIIQRSKISSAHKSSSSQSKRASLSILSIRKNLNAKKYEDSYKGFHFLRESMKTKMNNFRKEIQNNKIFSASKTNSFSLCYPAAYKINRTHKTQINVINMVSLDEYEDVYPTKKQFILNKLQNIRPKSSK